MFLFDNLAAVSCSVPLNWEEQKLHQRITKKFLSYLSIKVSGRLNWPSPTHPLPKKGLVCGQGTPVRAPFPSPAVVAYEHTFD